jgi:hypothetical protein
VRAALRRRAGLAALVLAPVLVLGLAGCAESGVSSTSVTSAPVTAAPTPWDPAALSALTTQRTDDFLRAARAFRKCDKQSWSSYGPAPCRKKVAAQTAVVDDFLGELDTFVLPADTVALRSSLAQLSTAGAKVAVRCAKNNDQPCDQALARFRADEQSVLWELDASL